MVTLDRAAGGTASIRADVRDLPFVSGAFSLVLCDSVMDTWMGWGHDCAAAELKRVVHPGGALLLIAAALEGSEEPAGARLTGREELLRWVDDFRLVELLYVRLDYPAASGVRAQWALLARRPA